MTDTRSLLTEREKTHGCFADVAQVAQEIKTAFYDPAESGAGIELNDVQHEALESIAVKMARIVCGDPGFRDHWLDIIGYAQLVVDHLDEPTDADVEVARKDICKACGAPSGTHYGACPLKPRALAFARRDMVLIGVKGSGIGGLDSASLTVEEAKAFLQALSRAVSEADACKVE